MFDRGLFLYARWAARPVRRSRRGCLRCVLRAPDDNLYATRMAANAMRASSAAWADARRRPAAVVRVRPDTGGSRSARRATRPRSSPTTAARSPTAGSTSPGSTAPGSAWPPLSAACRRPRSASSSATAPGRGAGHPARAAGTSPALPARARVAPAAVRGDASGRPVRPAPVARPGGARRATDRTLHRFRPRRSTPLGFDLLRRLRPLGRRAGPAHLGQGAAIDVVRNDGARARLAGPGAARRRGRLPDGG